MRITASCSGKTLKNQEILQEILVFNLVGYLIFILEERKFIT